MTLKISTHALHLNPKLNLNIELDVGADKTLPDDANCIFISPGFPNDDFPENDTASNLDILMPKDYGAYDKMVAVWEDGNLRKLQIGAMAQIVTDCMASITMQHNLREPAYTDIPRHDNEIRFNPAMPIDLWTISTHWVTVSVLPNPGEPGKGITLTLGNYTGRMDDISISQAVLRVLNYGLVKMQNSFWNI